MKEGYAKGIDDKFYPDAPVKRAELAKLIVKVLNLGELEVLSTDIFSDVDDQTVADKDVREAIQVLKNLKIVSGLNGKFYPATEITRGQTARIIAEALEAPAKLAPAESAA